MSRHSWICELGQKIQGADSAFISRLRKTYQGMLHIPRMHSRTQNRILRWTINYFRVMSSENDALEIIIHSELPRNESLTWNRKWLYLNEALWCKELILHGFISCLVSRNGDKDNYLVVDFEEGHAQFLSKLYLSKWGSVRSEIFPIRICKNFLWKSSHIKYFMKVTLSDSCIELVNWWASNVTEIITYPGAKKCR